MFYTCIVNLCFQIKIEIVQINNYKVKKLIYLLNNTRMQKVYKKELSNVFVRHRYKQYVMQARQVYLQSTIQTQGNS